MLNLSEKYEFFKAKILEALENAKNRSKLENLKIVSIFVTKFAIFFNCFLFALFFFIAIYLKIFNPTITPLMVYRVGFGLSKLHAPTFIPYENIPQDFKNLVLCVEDQSFYQHHGFDISAINQAITSKMKTGKYKHGASTLTQQLARTLCLTPHRNFFRKYIELIAAVEFDFILGKQRVLELYLNAIEWGDNVYGLSDASQFHYNKPFSTLSQDEKIRLVTIIASPVKYNVRNFAANRILKKRNQFLRRYGYRWYPQPNN